MSHHKTMVRAAENIESKLALFVSGLSNRDCKGTDYMGMNDLKVLASTADLLAFDCPVITIAGTNGKGSCASMLSSCYVNAGFNVGCYTSPHLMQVNERIKINQIDIDDNSLLAALLEVERLLSGGSVGFFVHMTLASFIVFKQYKLDVLILEVGLGGRIDPVNLVDPSIALIPSISLDHTDRLGDNIESIAYEKAGIMRPGIDVIYGGDVLPKAIADQAKKIKSTLHCINAEFSLTSVLAEVPSIKFYKNNIACVLYALKLLQDRLPISLSLMHEGLTKAVLPGRFDVVKIGDITVIFDVAHNASSAKVLADNMQQHIEYASCYAVFSALASKSVLDIVSPLDAIVDDWFVAPLSYIGGESISVIQQTLVSQEVSFSVYADMAAAFMGAYNKALTDSCACIVVYGSFHVVSEVLRVVRPMLHGLEIVS